MNDHTILRTPPSTVDENELDDALHVAPPSRASLRATRALSAVLFVALGAAGATWWADRSGIDDAQRPSFAAGQLPGGAGLPAGAALPGGGTGAGPASGGTGTSAASSQSATTPTVVGKVVAIDGDVITVQDLGGTEHRVRTTSTTKVTASTTVALDSLEPGSTVVVLGTKKDDGSVDASAVTAR